MDAGTSVEAVLAKAVLYRFLSWGYSYPDGDFVGLLTSGESWAEISEAGELIAPEVKDIIGQIRNWVAGYEGDVKRLLDDLCLEYTYLFINAVPKVPAPPYESAYVDKGLLMGRPVSEVLQKYREAGLTIREDYDGLPDHIAAELEFMAYLAQKEAEALSAGGESSLWRKRQHRFLKEHLLRWEEGFLERVKTHARKPFYRLLAELTQAVLRSEAGAHSPAPLSLEERTPKAGGGNGQGNVN